MFQMSHEERKGLIESDPIKVHFLEPGNFADERRTTHREQTYKIQSYIIENIKVLKLITKS